MEQKKLITKPKTKALNKALVSKSFCECEQEYGHKWNKKGDRLICVECEKYV
jgi:hypothetical protein